MNEGDLPRYSPEDERMHRALAEIAVAVRTTAMRWGISDVDLASILAQELAVHAGRMVRRAREASSPADSQEPT